MAWYLAFKVNAAGGRTDLVMGNRIDNPSKVEETAFGMVLTEWKLAEEENKVAKKYEEGRKQADLYNKTGILAGIELTNIRYIIVVTKDLVVNEYSDIVEGDVIYKFLNTAVDPSRPSEVARK